MKCTLTGGQSMFSCAHCRAALKKVSDDYYANQTGGLMNTSDEMRRGEKLRKADARPERLTANAEEFTARVAVAPERLDRGEYWCEVAMRRGKQLNEQWLEIRSMSTRVQIFTTLAVLGWAAFILELLRV